MTFSLYHVANEYKSVLHHAYELDEITEDQVNELNSLQGNIEDKAVNIAAFIKNLEIEAASVTIAMKEMQDRRKRIENKIEYLSSYLKENLESCGLKEINKSPHFVIKVKQNPVSVVIDDESIISEEFKNKKEVISIDKIAIKNAIANGVIIEGAHLETKTRLEIK